jgi:hypothetical protein
MAKRRAGLHKEITAIFGGVPVPRQGETGSAPGIPGGEAANQGTGSGKLDRARLKPPVPPRPSTPAAQTPPQDTVTRGPARPVQSEKVKPEIGAEHSGPGLFEQIMQKLIKPQSGATSQRQKIATILVPVLFIILIVAFVRVLSPKGGSPVGSVESRSTGTVAGSIAKIDWQVPAPYPSTLRDPTKFGQVKPAGNNTAQTTEVAVEGIIWSDDHPLAIISGEVVTEGQEVAGVTVVKVERDSVEFEKDGKRWTQKVR